MHRWDLTLAREGFICAEPLVVQVWMCPPPSFGLLPAVVGRGWGSGGSRTLFLSPQTSGDEHLSREACFYTPIFVPKVLFLPGF